MEWNNELVQLFIDLYAEEPAIWNPRDPGHKNRNKVHDAWTRIRTKFCDGRTSISLQELKKKKDNLMATYRKLNAKVKSSATSGSGTNEVFKPNWPFYEQMAKFLHGVYKPTSTISSENTVDPDIELNEEEAIIHDDNVVDREVEDSLSSTNTDTSNSVIFKKPPNANNMKDVNRKRKIEHQMDQAFEVLKKISAEPEPVEEECTLYAKLLCAKLKCMDTFTRDIAMHEIDNVMYRLKQQQAFPRFQSSPNQPYAGFHLPQNQIASSYHQNMQSSVGYQASPYHCNQSSPQSNSQQKTNYQSSPQSHPQRRTNFQPCPQYLSQRRTNFQSSPQSHSQQSADFQSSPQSHTQQSADFQSSLQSHTQQLADFQPSPQSLSQQSADFQPSPQSHSQQSADFQPSPQSHSQQSVDFQPSPYSNSQQSSDMEEYSHSQPFPGFESLSKEKSVSELYTDEVSKLFEQTE